MAKQIQKPRPFVQTISPSMRCVDEISDYKGGKRTVEYHYTDQNGDGLSDSFERTLTVDGRVESRTIREDSYEDQVENHYRVLFAGFEQFMGLEMRTFENENFQVKGHKNIIGTVHDSNGDGLVDQVTASRLSGRKTSKRAMDVLLKDENFDGLLDLAKRTIHYILDESE